MTEVVPPGMESPPERATPVSSARNSLELGKTVGFDAAAGGPQPREISTADSVTSAGSSSTEGGRGAGQASGLAAALSAKPPARQPGRGAASESSDSDAVSTTFETLSVDSDSQQMARDVMVGSAPLPHHAGTAAGSSAGSSAGSGGAANGSRPQATNSNPITNRPLGFGMRNSTGGHATNPCRIFVGGIPWKATETALSEFFSSFGDVVECKIIIDKDTLQSKGYAFVTFSEPEAALRAKKCPEESLVLMNKRLNVGDAVRRTPEQHFGGSPGGSSPRGHRRHGSPRSQRHAALHGSRSQEQLWGHRGGLAHAQQGVLHSMQAFQMMQAMQAAQAMQQNGGSPVGSPGSAAMSPMMSPMANFMYPAMMGASPTNMTPEQQQAHAAMMQAQYVQAMQAQRMFARHGGGSGTSSASGSFSMPTTPHAGEKAFAGVNERGEPVFFDSQQAGGAQQEESRESSAAATPDPPRADPAAEPEPGQGQETSGIGKLGGSQEKVKRNKSAEL